MDFDVNLSVAGGTALVEAECPQGEDQGTARLPDRLGRDPDSGALGRQLFGLLFPKRVRTLFERCRGAARAQGENLRVRIRVHGNTKQLLRLHGLPWELLRDPDTGQCLALGREVEIVRYLKLPLPVPESLRLGGEPLEVLVVTAAPRDQLPLQGEVERRAIESAFEGSSVRVRTLCGATRRSLLDALRSGTTHVLHFIGHGMGPSRRLPGAIVLEREDGASDFVPARTLALIAEAAPSLRLVFLNACSTAAAGPESGHGLSWSAGPALALRGVPAVVAMQSPMFDTSAIEFARVFYESLRAGASIEAAAHAARLAIATSLAHETSWTIPAVFTRMTGGVIAPPEREPAAADRTPGGTVDLNAEVLQARTLTATGSQGSAPDGMGPPGNVSVHVRRIEADVIELTGSRRGPTRPESS